MKYTIGIDFGTLSARAVVVDPRDGKTVGECTFMYPHGVMDEALPDGTPLPPNFALQHPADYQLALFKSIEGALKSGGVNCNDICAIGIDFTSCTVVAHKLDGAPICMIEGFESDPHAYVKLWKHHGATGEAADFLRVAKERNEGWLSSFGDQVSSEWLFPKILETYRNSKAVYDTAERFSEAGDWLSLMLTDTETHTLSFAANKAFYTDSFPSPDFFEAVENGFGNVVGTKVCPDTVPAATSVGTLSARGAVLTGLPQGIIVATPQLDAHISLPALGITEPGTLMMILGTSGCYILHHNKKQPIPGICAAANEAVIPGLCTYEAGLASCGDHLDWFVKNCVPARYKQDADAQGISIHKYLRDKCKDLPVGKSGLMVLDWFNGNRCPLSDSDLSGLIVGMTLTTKPEEIYRALVEAVVFQTSIVIDCYKNAGVEIKEAIASGGIASKDEMLVQMLSDVLNIPIRVANSTQTAALGSAIYAAVAAGVYPDVKTAADKMSVGADKLYMPSPHNHSKYMELLDIYKTLHNDPELYKIMHKLKKTRSN